MNWKTLIWWLGPWCDQQKAPKNITREDFTVSALSRSFRFRVYSGSSQNGAVLVFPGLHPDGLDDERIDRFCKVLARAGAVVGVPELPTMMQSVMVPELLGDAEASAQFFASYISELGQDTFGVFCISASSIAGLHLASHAKWSSVIGRLHLFGGFVDWVGALRFAMTGRVPNVEPPEKIEIDPLSLPVVYMNLMRSFPQFLELESDLQREMFERLHGYVSQSWEKPEVNHPVDTQRIAADIFSQWERSSAVMDVDWGVVGRYFYQACALESGGCEYVESFLDHQSTLTLPSDVQWLDVSSYLHKINTPLDISHGRDDFVVPYSQAAQLATQSTSESTRVFVTGLYHHTGVVSVSRLLRLLVGLPKEIWTSIRMVRALADLADGGARN